MNNASIHPISRVGLFALALGVLGVSGCAADRDNLITTASTAATTGYLIHEEDEADEYTRARDFADRRLAALRRDAASGGGEHLHAFAVLMDAPDPQAFGRWMQAHYGVLFDNTQQPANLVARIHRMRARDAPL